MIYDMYNRLRPNICSTVNMLLCLGVVQVERKEKKMSWHVFTGDIVNRLRCLCCGTLAKMLQ